jgi:hypothetical protein
MQKRSLIFILCFVLSTLGLFAQVSISTDNTLSDPSAMLDVQSTSRGMLVPRMSSGQRDAIVSPAAGLIIFNTDNKLFYFNGGSPAVPNWLVVNSQWLTNGSGINFNGGKVGLGTSVPATVLDIAGGNNWDLVNGEGDFRIGNSQYRLKMGLALGGGGAGAAGIMQYGQPGGYNVLKLGAQGNYLLYINGSSQGVGIGTDNPVAALDINGSFRLADGTQGAGKVLTSNASGVASWAIEGSSTAHFIGENYGGGIVFYVYDNGRHGLIAATADLPTVRWFGGSFNITRARANGVNAGMKNTAIVIANQGSVDGEAFAATVCNEYSVTIGSVTYGDWYLPSIFELNVLYQQRAIVGGFSTAIYWSSTEYDINNAWMQYFSFNGASFSVKNAPHAVRAIRAF